MAVLVIVLVVCAAAIAAAVLNAGIKAKAASIAMAELDRRVSVAETQAKLAGRTGRASLRTLTRGSSMQDGWSRMRQPRAAYTRWCSGPWVSRMPNEAPDEDFSPRHEALYGLHVRIEDLRASLAKR